MSESKATVPISGRVAEEDFAFLMEYPISGKVTASEKLRYVVSFYRAYHESLDRYEESLTELNRLLEPVRKDVKRAEMETGCSSELVDRMMQALPEAMAFLITARLPGHGDKQLPALLDLEDTLSRAAIGLIQSILRMGLTSRSPTYNPTLLRDKMGTIRELVAMGDSESISNPNA